MTTEYRIVYSTCPNQEVAEKIAGVLVTEKLAACVNIIPGLKSVYMWKGECAVDTEVLLMIKTRADVVTALTGRIVAEHPYELPEVVAVPITAGLPAYLAWIENEVNDI